MSPLRDNSERRAVLVSLSKEDDGIRICLDDVQQQSRTALGEWTQREPYTSKLISEEALEELTFDEKELADFGYAIIARLYAFKLRGEI
jgi:hypothetical protein